MADMTFNEFKEVVSTTEPHSYQTKGDYFNRALFEINPQLHNEVKNTEHNTKHQKEVKSETWSYIEINW